MIKAHKIKLYPTRYQEILLRKSCGVARYSYNWGLAKWKELHEAGERPTAYNLIKLQNSIKRIEMPFFMEVSKTAPQYAIHNLQKAFIGMWKQKRGYPKFKKKGVRDSFVAVENKEQFNQAGNKLRLPRIGYVKCSERLRFEGKVNNVVVSRVANMWFATINIETPDPIPALKQITGDNQAIVGVDLGVKSMMVLSDGAVFENPRSLRSNIKSLQRLHRQVSRKLKGGKNRVKAKNRLAKKHYRVSCIRSKAIHQVTKHIAKTYDKVVVEDLNASGMAKNRRLARAVADVSFGEIVRQLTYKCAWNGVELIKADRWFPSSKTCSNCGHKKNKLKLSERIYNCENCGISIDRDLNAAKNLASYSPTSKSEGSHAFGVGSSPVEIQDSPTLN